MFLTSLVSLTLIFYKIGDLRTGLDLGNLLEQLGLLLYHPVDNMMLYVSRLRYFYASRHDMLSKKLTEFERILFQVYGGHFENVCRNQNHFYDVFNGEETFYSFVDKHKLTKDILKRHTETLIHKFDLKALEL